MTVVEFRNDNDVLICDECQHLTTWLECRLRMFNELRCGRCGGALKAFRTHDVRYTAPRDPNPHGGGSPGPGAA